MSNSLWHLKQVAKKLHLFLKINLNAYFFQETKYEHQLMNEFSDIAELPSACRDKVCTAMANAPMHNELSIQRHEALHSLGMRGMPGAEQPLELPG